MKRNYLYEISIWHSAEREWLHPTTTTSNDMHKRRVALKENNREEKKRKRRFSSWREREREQQANRLISFALDTAIIPQLRAKYRTLYIYLLYDAADPKSLLHAKYPIKPKYIDGWGSIYRLYKTLRAKYWEDIISLFWDIPAHIYTVKR